MIDVVQQAVRVADGLIARAYLSMFQERSGLLAFLFHSLFRDEAEIALNHIDPLQRTTLAKFRSFIEYYLEHGYEFVGPDALANGLEPGGKYAMITFDDGYANNALALPLLEEFRIPALIFVSTEHVKQNKCFWWDVLYRERLAEGASFRRIYRDQIAMKDLETEQIEARLKARFGETALQPRGEIDRPFTPGELRELARSPYVYLGNHTADHAILTNYPADQMRRQIAKAQDDLFEMTGVRPSSIAYPNGNLNSEVLRSCRDSGLKIGFTVRPSKNPLPPPHASALTLGRFCLHDAIPIEDQCRTYRSDLLIYGAFRSWYLQLRRIKTRDLILDESSGSAIDLGQEADVMSRGDH